MRDKFPRDFKDVTELSYNPLTGRIDIIKETNQD